MHRDSSEQEHTLDNGRNVLAVYIGWSATYDGKEMVHGTHGWLNQNGDDCSEAGAFRRRRGVYRCGIGSGSVPSGQLDIMFVAKPPGTRARHVVGLYLDAHTELWNSGNTDNDWRGAVTRDAILLPISARFAVSDWPGRSGTRRWARGPHGTQHRPLLDDYHRAVALGRTPRLDTARGDEDDELAGFEGELRGLFIAHRSRERSLRDAKVRVALRAGEGHLRCEVPGCGFDFLDAYGAIGAGYAHVHHTKPLAAAPAHGTRSGLADLAIVCANCHAMIHRGGECRPLGDVRPKRRRTVR